MAKAGRLDVGVSELVVERAVGDTICFCALIGPRFCEENCAEGTWQWSRCANGARGIGGDSASDIWIGFFRVACFSVTLGVFFYFIFRN